MDTLACISPVIRTINKPDLMALWIHHLSSQKAGKHTLNHPLSESVEPHILTVVYQLEVLGKQATMSAAKALRTDLHENFSINSWRRERNE